MRNEKVMQFPRSLRFEGRSFGQQKNTGNKTDNEWSISAVGHFPTNQEGN